ncbi:MAG: hypothetical protein Q7K42_06000 [Candidatus Diapherotrites archaeon]|nr:hypothetical protein [Candidatus Diapherotrites archaeon]
MEAIELDDFVGQPCKSKLAYEFIPKKQMNFDLQEVNDKLLEKQVFVEVNTPYLLIAHIQETAVSFFKSGKIMVKNTKDMNLARKIAEKFIEKVFK